MVNMDKAIKNNPQWWYDILQSRISVRKAAIAEPVRPGSYFDLAIANVKLRELYKEIETLYSHDLSRAVHKARGQ